MTETHTTASGHTISIIEEADTAPVLSMTLAISHLSEQVFMSAYGRKKICLRSLIRLFGPSVWLIKQGWILKLVEI